MRCLVKIIYLVLIFANLNCWTIAAKLPNGDSRNTEQCLKAYAPADCTLFLPTRNQVKLLEIDLKYTQSSIKAAGNDLITSQQKDCFNAANLTELKISPLVSLSLSQLNI
jgi:hypothetical protein